MKHNYFLIVASLFTCVVLSAQSYAPPAGQSGTTAISRDSDVFIAWATTATVVRGPQNITNPTGPNASAGIPDNAIGSANGSIVSLGDGGTAILTFDNAIENGNGIDFAIFENSFSDTFLELAFVEVSSDGVNYFRFPAHSETQTSTQVGGFGSVDATYINNLAGKYRATFGTPFDLDDIVDTALLNKDNVTHVKFIDAIGTIDPTFATYDSFGNIVNEPYATPFSSCGFDLDAVGVINQKTLGLKDFDNNSTLGIHPNPATSKLYISKTGVLNIYSITGELVINKTLTDNKTAVLIEELSSGIYIIKLTNTQGVFTQKLIKK